MRIAVVGVGTAGIMSLCHLLNYAPQGSKVVSIFEPTIPILGIGESSTFTFPKLLFKGTGFNLPEDGAELDSTIKLSVTYKNWRENSFESFIEPIDGYAMHFNNFRMKEFAFDRFKEIWGSRFEELTGTVVDIKNNGAYASVYLTNSEEKFDIVIDCRGYPTDYSDYVIAEDMPVNHCLVNMIPEPGLWPSTVHQATKNGWMFGIPLKTRQGWGYLYNDNITTREDAVADIAEIFNTTVDKLTLREFAFKNYYAKTFFDGRILKNGNRALFFEPLEALSSHFYELAVRSMFDYFLGDANMNTPEKVNQHLTTVAGNLENFYHYVYHGGSIYNTPFWQITKEKSSKKLKNNKLWKETVAEISSCITDEGLINRPVASWMTSKWLDWERKFGYSIFKKPHPSLYLKD